jgi:hypothetical protein
MLLKVMMRRAKTPTLICVFDNLEGVRFYLNCINSRINLREILTQISVQKSGDFWLLAKNH